MADTQSRKTILCYGHDEVLLETRQKILEQIGRPVEITSNEHFYRRRLLQGDIALVLLCQSLPAEECRKAADFATESSPLTKLLLMYPRPGQNRHHDHAELFSEYGPPALLHTVRRLLSSDSRSTA